MRGRGYCYARKESNLKLVFFENGFLTRIQLGGL